MCVCVCACVCSVYPARSKPKCVGAPEIQAATTKPIPICIHTYIHTCIRDTAPEPIPIYKNTYRHTYNHSIPICILSHIHTYIQAYICIHKYINTHIYTYIGVRWRSWLPIPVCVRERVCVHMY